MITLYSYSELFGVADNNGYGLKVFAFLRLAGVPFTHQHIFDASKAPRGQLPYIVDDGETIGDSETIITHVIAKYRPAIDAALTAAQRDHGPRERRLQRVLRVGVAADHRTAIPIQRLVVALVQCRERTIVAAPHQPREPLVPEHAEAHR